LLTSVFAHRRLRRLLNDLTATTDVARGELFNRQQLGDHARQLAAKQKVTFKHQHDPLQGRLRRVERDIEVAYQAIVAVSKTGQRLPPAADWLLDNYYLIEEHIRLTKRHLPRGYSRTLPRLDDGPFRYYPRAFLLARELIAHIDARVDGESIEIFVAAWQDISELTLGELWAIPIMIRVAIIENLRHVILHLLSMVNGRQMAIRWADRLQATAEEKPSAVVSVVSELAQLTHKEPTLLSATFVAEFTRRLRGAHPALSVALTWLGQRLAELHTTTEILVQNENQAQATDQQSMGNGITSLRSLAAIDWRGFVEKSSRVEHVLRKDPASIHARMDFATRDMYRHRIEDIAKKVTYTEREVAERALALAQQRADKLGAYHREAHVGYFLVDKGQHEHEQAIRYRRDLLSSIPHLLRVHPLLTYVGAISLCVIATLALSSWWLISYEISPYAIALLSICIAILASQCATTVVNWLVTLAIKPQPLPRIELDAGIPEPARTLVVIPTLMRKPSDVDSLVDNLEIRFLANVDPQLDFSLLTDFGDAKQEVLPSDEALVQKAVTAIAVLNQKYAHIRPGIFALFHRPRRFNASEGAWMGRERKRGKIEDLNALLLRGERDHFSAITAEPTRLSCYKYIITLDTDTQLPRDAARKMVGTLMHPLNHACFTSDNRVSSGYVILQPRAAINLPSAGRSFFAQIFSGEPGIDPYSRAVSDVYQDLFGEGSFVGKGIYDLAAFDRSLHGRFPDNAILSHDLIEGSFSRAGLLSDVLVFEDHPMRYGADVTRRQRWLRGDWQLLPWLMPRVPQADGKRVKNTLSSLAKWKLLDNLRRGFVAPALLALLIGSWLVLPNDGLVISLILVLLLIPVALGLIAGLARKPADIPLLMHVRLQGNAAFLQVTQVLLGVVFLIYETVVNIEAMLRTLWRMVISKKRLLEWTTASDAERNAAGNLPGVFLAMWSAPAIAFATAAFVNIEEPYHFYDSVWLLFVWAASPAIAWFISRQINHEAQALTAQQTVFLGRTARKTWRYYQRFVTEQDHYLAPDNYQEYPVEALARRTSPTNLGLSLLANLAAHDFGYITSEELTTRCENTLASMGTLERYKGHFFNWYKTDTKEAILPLYVSMVDSGNLAGHLMVLSVGLHELRDAPILHPALCRGLQHSFGLMVQQARTAQARAGGTTYGWMARLSEFQRLWSDIARDLEQPPKQLSATLALLGRCLSVTEDFQTNIATASDEELRWWTSAVIHECRAHRDYIERYAPWSRLPPPPDIIFSLPIDAEQRLVSLRNQLERLDRTVSLNDCAAFVKKFTPDVEWFVTQFSNHAEPAVKHAAQWCDLLKPLIISAQERASALIERLNVAHVTASRFASDMEWEFLFDRGRELFTIGYNVSNNKRDLSYYDLLASEARLGSFVAIAQGKIPQEHWFKLGRLLTSTRAAPALLSWAGSMFEYLMPPLVMPTYPGTILDQTNRAVVRRQMDYASHRRLPAWGISESGYFLTDAQLNYQYRAFGVPGLGLKRGLSDDLVIAPYASAMALLVAPQEACDNLYKLFLAGHEGRYGFYEAIDYTPSRMAHGANGAAVRSFMVHHQGMAFLGYVGVLHQRPMQRRFMQHPLFKATELLLQERIPKSAPVVFPHAAEADETKRGPATEGESTMRVFTNPAQHYPQVHLLSNGRYHVMVTDAGSGQSRWHQHALTRWRADAVRDNDGSYCYLRDVSSGQLWSTTWQPTLVKPEKYEAIFQQGRAEYKRLNFGIESHCEIAVSPEEDVELRRVTLINRSPSVRTIELTSYSECVIAPPSSDAAHPAFSNLFVQTRLHRERDAIIAWRRPRSDADKHPWVMHLSSVKGREAQKISFETSREKFIGRTRGLTTPQAFDKLEPLSDTVGSVLDPILAIRRTVVIQPGESAQIDFVYAASANENSLLELCNDYHEQRMTDRVISMGWNHSQVVLGQLGASEADAQLFGRLASSLLYVNPTRRAPAGLLAANRLNQSALWSYGISGDLPIVLLKNSDGERMPLLRQLINAHAYWRLKGVAVDLIVWNDDTSVYRQDVADRMIGLITSSPEAHLLNKPGGIFILRSDTMSENERILLQTTARIVLSDNEDKLRLAAEPQARHDNDIPLFTLERVHRTDPIEPQLAIPHDVRFGNGLGGLSADGREYIITLDSRQATPSPWVNVLANPSFGSVISEMGAAYTWDNNSHEYRLTPWHNDAVRDDSGECFYLRDHETGSVWSPMPWPVRGGTYTIRHGFGYSTFEQRHAGLMCDLTVFVPLDAAVKIHRLRIRNTSARARTLTAAGCVDWVLGEQRSKTAPFIVTELEPRFSAVVARNRYAQDFPDKLAFFTTLDANQSVTGDRSEFYGFCGMPQKPAALNRVRLSGRLGAGYDPCAGVMTTITIAPHEEADLIFLLGTGDSVQAIGELIARFNSRSAIQGALENVQNYWQRMTNTLQLTSTDSSIDYLVNGWLPYQIQSCRLWARSGFYQSGGAFGFRDQLQDIVALLHHDPAAARAHIIRSAARQFTEGDVQHWWHPPHGRGVRTRISDDLVWLPYAVERYVTITGDHAILQEIIPFLHGRPLQESEDNYYDLPTISSETATLHDHCKRALQKARTHGSHGLPLMGSGDWNDGMNLVGINGKGESVWLGFFLGHVLQRYAPIADNFSDHDCARWCHEQASALASALDKNAWDGAWYTRAWNDDGQVLGSLDNNACRIDSLPQAWAALSGLCDNGRARQAMNAVDQQLVQREAGLIAVFTPPFDKQVPSPGYIQGYIPGVRENGGQYTHAAVWAIMGFAALGNAEKAWELLRLIDPVRRGGSPELMAKTRGEPYVVAADVYSNDAHAGRTGWSWYTGSAGWMYRLIIESLIGFERNGNRFRMRPCVGAQQLPFTLRYRHAETLYIIEVSAGAQAGVVCDGQAIQDEWIPLQSDNTTHNVAVTVTISGDK
jgi:cyclic beta-1,2-glucan synthetase